MNRLLSTLRLDILIQWRSRFHLVSIGISLLLGLGMRALLDPIAIPYLMPAFLLFSVGGTAFLYIAGLIIYERDQHTLDALFVSPLSISEYWASKLMSLALLEIVEGVVIVAVAMGVDGVNWFFVILGLVAMSLMFTLAGAILIVRYASITDFLIPATLLLLPFQAPAIYFMGISDSWMWLLSPAGAPTMLMKGGFQPLQGWELAYGVGYSLLIISGFAAWALRAFEYHIIWQRGN